MTQRTIKFRAWDGKKLLPQEDFVAMTQGKTLIISLVAKDKGQAEETFVQRLDLLLEQFTGLLDKNGKEIYEGDLVRRGIRTSEVYWDNTLLGFRAKARYQDGEDVTEFNMVDALHTGVEVIGNIHENPNLLP